MNRYNYLFKNIGLLTVGQFTTKIIAFLLTPLYTSILLTEEYGIYEIYNTTVFLFLPILTLNILEGTLRYSMDENHKLDSLAVGLKYSIIGFFLFGVVILVNMQFKIYPILNDYWYYLFLHFMLLDLSSLLTSYARGIDKVGAMALSGVVGAVVTIISNIIFLVVYKWGLNGYFFAALMGSSIQIIYLLTVIKPVSRIRQIKIEKSFDKEMRSYSIPLIWNALAWWINDISDRYIVTAMCGLAANGVYAVAYKIPTILTVFQTVFSRAWTLSAVKEYDKNDKNGFFSKTYEAYNLLIVIVCSFLILFDKPLSKFLFRNDYYEAWKFAPFLLIAVIFGALSGYIGAIFTAVKNTKIFSFSTGVGAVINIFFNFVLIHFYGVIGAAISTCFSNVIIWTIRMVNVRKYIVLNINLKKHIISYLLLLLQTIVTLQTNDNTMLSWVSLITTVLICILYYKEIKTVIKKCLNIIISKRIKKE